MNLSNLQKLQIEQIRLEEIENHLKDINNDQYLFRLKKEYNNLKDKLEVYNINLKSVLIKQDIERNEIGNLEENKNSLENIKYSKDINTVKKLESIDKQIIELKAKIATLEEILIKYIEEGENIEREINETKKKLHFIKRKYMTLKEEKDKGNKALIEEKNFIEKEIIALKSQIDDSCMQLYDKIRKRYKNPIASVYHRICGGCKMEIGGMDYEKVKEGSAIVHCESCGRILVYANINDNGTIS